MTKTCYNCRYQHFHAASFPCCRCSGGDDIYWEPNENVENQLNLYRRLLRNSANSTYGYRTLIIPSIKNVIFNPPATIVFWEDNTKTVVKCGDGDIFDPEKGLAMAISKKVLGNRGNYFNEIKKWVEPYEKSLEFTSKEMTPFGSAIAKGIKNAAAHFEAIADSEILKKISNSVDGTLPLLELEEDDDTPNCYTCKYLDVDVFEHPCRKCYDYDKHEPKDENIIPMSICDEDEDDDTTTCYTCKYFDLELDEYPCSECNESNEYSKHEPKESSDE